ncbi:acetylglutamate kinase [Streptococcus caballi]|uniref:acetylglutamate kinase n=1 Tax=Streptococcus caballi TaxID=439220 RepID=UPI000379C081|nr:acetylglutamate kinase [Streptococcus caballi]
MENIIVIKIGGVASQHLSQDFINQIKNWKEAGKQLVIVHGGGFAINKLMEEEHVPVKKINGLRVTSQSDMKLVSYALLNIVGENLVKKLNQSSIDSIQLLSDIEKVVQADFLDKETYGYVGNVSQIQTEILEKMLANQMLPVLASIGYSKDGDMLNINADYLATAVAVALRAEKLVLMTDVKGVLENGAVLDSLSSTECQDKIEQGIITGGMIPKIESAVNTVLAGVGEVLIGDNLATGTSIIC